MLSTGSAKTTVLFRYEKLSDFCYLCGMLDHVDKDCPVLFSSLDSSLLNKRGFDPWLRAEGRRGVNLEEILSTLPDSVSSPVTTVASPLPSLPNLGPDIAVTKSSPVNSAQTLPVPASVNPLVAESSGRWISPLRPTMVNIDALDEQLHSVPSKGS